MKSTMERFYEKVQQTDGCWLWKGNVNNSGYGRFWDGTRTVYSHRWAYTVFVGPIPEGLEIDLAFIPALTERVG